MRVIVSDTGRFIVSRKGKVVESRATVIEKKSLLDKLMFWKKTDKPEEISELAKDQNPDQSSTELTSEVTTLSDENPNMIGDVEESLEQTEISEITNETSTDQYVIVDVEDQSNLVETADESNSIHVEESAELSEAK